MTATTTVRRLPADATRAWAGSGRRAPSGDFIPDPADFPGSGPDPVDAAFLTVGNSLLDRPVVAIAGVAAVGPHGRGSDPAARSHLSFPRIMSVATSSPSVAAERRARRAARRCRGPLPRAADRARERSPQSVLEDRCAAVDVGHIYVPSRGAVHPYERPNDAGSRLAHRSARPLYCRRSPIRHHAGAGRAGRGRRSALDCRRTVGVGRRRQSGGCLIQRHPHLSRRGARAGRLRPDGRDRRNDVDRPRGIRQHQQRRRLPAARHRRGGAEWSRALRAARARLSRRSSRSRPSEP